MSHCLIIDDDKGCCELIKKVAADQQFDCVAVPSGYGAVEVCLERMPDVIILDWMMPKMNGLEFLTHLRTMEHGDMPYVIVCSGIGEHLKMDASVMAKVMKNVSADAFLAKPFAIKELQSLLMAVAS